MTDQNVFQRLLTVQKTATAPRSISGKFGKGRSAEQILEAYKPICNDNGLFLNTSDVIVHVGDRHYVTTTATVTNVDKPEETHSASASAWEGNIPLSNSGNEILDTSQVSGKTSSYAKKYALQNLFAIDDTKDADRDDETVVYNSRPKEIRNRTEEIAEGNSEILARAKASIKAQLIKQDYADADRMQAFIKNVIGKDTIDNLNDADSVADALDNEL